MSIGHNYSVIAKKGYKGWMIPVTVDRVPHQGCSEKANRHRESSKLLTEKIFATTNCHFIERNALYSLF